MNEDIETIRFELELINKQISELYEKKDRLYLSLVEHFHPNATKEYVLKDKYKR